MPTYNALRTHVKLRVWDPSRPWSTHVASDGENVPKTLAARLARARLDNLKPIDAGLAKDFVYEDLVEEYVAVFRPVL